MRKKSILLIVLAILLPLIIGTLLYVTMNLFNENETILLPSDIIGLFFQYCSHVLTIVLAVIVYYQNERVNQLERLSYDYYIGIKNIIPNFSFNQLFVESGKDKADDYTLTQNFSTNRVVNFINLDVSTDEHKSNYIVAFNLITKNRLLITDINIKEIKVWINTKSKKHICKTLKSSSSHISSCFEDGSIIPLAIGFVSDYKVEDLEFVTLDLTIALKDQKEKEHDFSLKGKILCYNNSFYLSSSATCPL